MFHLGVHPQSISQKGLSQGPPSEWQHPGEIVYGCRRKWVNPDAVVSGPWRTEGPQTLMVSMPCPAGVSSFWCENEEQPRRRPGKKARGTRRQNQVFFFLNNIPENVQIWVRR